MTVSGMVASPAVFAAAVEEGVVWDVVLAVVLENYLELVELWTVSRNTSGHIQRPENEVAGLTKLLHLWTQQKEMGNDPHYPSILKDVTRGNPCWKGLVHHFCSFQARRSGGVQGKH